VRADIDQSARETIQDVFATLIAHEDLLWSAWRSITIDFVHGRLDAIEPVR
jgi:hypothetical protein